MKPPNRSYQDTTTGAAHCIAGERCQGRAGVRACPYYDKRTGSCRGDWRRDLLRWAQYLHEEANRDRSGSL